MMNRKELNVEEMGQVNGGAGVPSWYIIDGNIETEELVADQKMALQSRIGQNRQFQYVELPVVMDELPQEVIQQHNI